MEEKNYIVLCLEALGEKIAALQLELSVERIKKDQLQKELDERDKAIKAMIERLEKEGA